jgi:multiple sugar transport system permease protein
LGRYGRLGIFYLILIAVAAVFICPYIFAIFAAFKPLSGVVKDRAWVPPGHFDTSNFSEVLHSQHFLTYLGNTAMLAIIITIGQVLFSMMGAYAFARMKFPGRDLLFWVYLATLMVPNVVTLVPMYIIMNHLHLLNTYWAIFLPYVLGTPYAIFLMRQFFLTIPEELIEAARLDGCGEQRIMWRVVVPLSKPILLTAGVIAFVFGWNNFLWPLIVTDSTSLRVVTVGISNLQSNFTVQWNLVLAGSLIALVPMLIVFSIFQKYIVRSIQLTGVNR